MAKVIKDKQKKLWVYLVIVTLIGTVGFLSGFKKNPNSPYIGTWKLEDILLDGRSIKQKHFIILQISPDGNFVIWMDLVSITGTYEILDDGRLQLSEEFLGEKPIKPPTISEWSIQSGKLIKSSGRQKTIFKR